MKKILLLIVGMSLILIVFGCSKNHNEAVDSEGRTCEEITAMLQKGVDKYKEQVGQAPTELRQLVDDPGVRSWGGPYVDEIPDCPNGDQYVIKNGKVEVVEKK